MADMAYEVWDKGSRNCLGEFERLQEAKLLFIELVEADPRVARELAIWSLDGEEHPVAEEEIAAAIRRASQPDRAMTRCRIVVEPPLDDGSGDRTPSSVS